MAITIAVLGLGYVGCVSAACLASLGHRIIGVDVNPEKADLVNRGIATISEQDMDRLLAEQHLLGRVAATCDLERAVAQADVSLICVGTPSAEGGSADLGALFHVGAGIGAALRGKSGLHVVAVRSTVPPGSCAQMEQVIAGASESQPGVGFSVASNPEFLREGSSVQDYFHPPYTVLGSRDEEALAVLRQLYAGIDAPVVETDRETAEMLKYASNVFHALKISFANELGVLCKSLGVDSYQLMETFCLDHRLNISPAYLKPGFAFGGSCLPKDLRAMASMAEEHGLEVPLIAAIGSSNRRHLDRAIDLILSLGGERVGILGMAFKSGTDDLRESPVVELIEALLARGRRVSVHDPLVSAERLLGANRQYADKRLPGLAMLLENDLDHLREDSDLLVVAQNSAEYRGIALEMIGKVPVIDLTGALVGTSLSGNYHGLAW